MNCPVDPGHIAELESAQVLTCLPLASGTADDAGLLQTRPHVHANVRTSQQQGQSSLLGQNPFDTLQITQRSNLTKAPSTCTSCPL
ncbi:hypothetical protein HaLaN_19740 [Haematococcus lacustris]|uniref:Uncharacterized protein n=1 Tax=Haematococcus lacustris TaxID=44745 RepID=A0A699ZI97_HAELA|nr:hypothetical protein HaLaN_19740 [Haematococcus lacustris]